MKIIIIIPLVFFFSGINICQADGVYLHAENRTITFNGLSDTSIIDYDRTDNTSLPINANTTDTILSNIKGNTDIIAEQTSPKKFLGIDSDKSSLFISLFAAIFGFMAAAFGLGGYIYQKKSAKSLKEMQPKRLPFNIFSKKIYNQILTLDILIEIEKSDLPEQNKIERRSRYNIKKILEDMRMPDDLIDLSCYEKYNDNKIYQKAFEIIFQWRSYNTLLDEANLIFSGVKKEDLLDLYEYLRKENVSLLNELACFEDMFREVTFLRNKSRKKNKKIIKAKTELAIDILENRLYMIGVGLISNSFVNPKLFCSNAVFGEKDVDIPSFDKINKSSQSLSFPDKIQLAILRLFSKKKKEDLAFSISVSHLDIENKRIYEILYRVFCNLNARRNRIETKYSDSDADESNIENQKKDPLSENIFSTLYRWLDSYFKCENDLDRLNVDFLFRIIQALEVSSRRRMLLESRDNPDSLKEREFFERQQLRYNSFGFIYSEGAGHYEKHLSLFNILCAIVAEQSLDITFQYLQTWRYHYVYDIDREWNDDMVSQPVKMRDVDILLTFLEKQGITKSNCLVISTKDELMEKIKNVPKELMYDFIQDSDSYLSELKLWTKSQEVSE